MTKILSEDIRDILNKLDEYITSVNEEDKKQDDVAGTGSNADDDKNDDSDETVDTVLTKSADLKKIIGNLNSDTLSSVLDIPRDQVSDFKSALTMLGNDEPHLNSNQAMAIVTGFKNVLTRDYSDRAKLSGMLHATGGVNEDADISKVLSNAGIKPAPGKTPQQQSDELKNSIEALRKDPNAKEELKLKEAGSSGMDVEVLFYNSGYGEKLDAVANDPKRKRKVTGSLEMNPSTGAPQLKFTEKNDNQIYYAEWNPRYGWVADLD